MPPRRFRIINLLSWWITVIACSAFTASAPAQSAPPAEIDGVYNGSCAGDKGPTKLKLTLTTQTNGTLIGVLMLYLPEGSGTTAYTCHMDGRYLPGRGFQLVRLKWETVAPKNLNMFGINGTFDAAGGQGAGKISGKLLPPGPDYEVTRDTAQSSGMPTVVAASKAAKAFSPTVINGVYNGEYRRSDGNVKLKFSIKSTDDGALTGLFTFELPRKPGSSITYKLTGKYVAGAHDYGLASSPFQFTTIEPVGSAAQDALGASKAQAVHVGITGPGVITGSLTGSNPGSGEFNCGWVSATMDRTASTELDKIMAAQASAGSTAAATVAPVVRSSIDGVYNGTYTNKQGTTRFKLALWTKQENGGLGGVLTFYLPEGSGTNTYTCELKGFFIPAHGNQPDRIQLIRTKWEKQPPRDLLFEAGLEGVFDAHGNNGAGQYSGYMSDASNSPFQAVRDAAESASLASARLADNRQPSVAGVFNGTYTRENEPPTKFKLTMTYPTGGGTGASADLAGVATIYLAIDSGTKAYTYSLKGAEDGYGNFELKVYDWETIPPKDFKNFKAMGFNGKFVPDMTRNTARIVSVQQGSDATFFVPTFEATWDATESQDIQGAIAAQKAVGDADQVAALKLHAEVLKNAQPKQLASKDLVRKSKAYWSNYRSDFIREIFDGGFADDVDKDPAFQVLFVDYVDLFSKNCAAYLPADSKSVTITTVTTTTYPGGAANTETTSKTVEVDTRFIPKYVEYSGVDPAPGSDQAKEQTAKTIAIAGQIFHRPGPYHGVGPADAIALLHLEAAHGLVGGAGMDKFFATEVKANGPSAALRQMGENLLRGATGEPSLQEAGAKIDGAQAETDKDLPPGRYAHFIDAAHAFYRDPANTRFAGRFETAFDETLAAKYHDIMTPEEEYFYANDFEGRFRDQIMQPRDRCTDPAWPRLHPAVEDCVTELGQ